MNNQHENLINKCYRSSNDSIIGKFYYDCSKKKVKKIIKSEMVYISFNYSLGCRWTQKNHLITETKTVTKKQADNYLNDSYYNEKMRA